jgi:membrane-bound lytic murein transglycosylase D
MNTTKNKLFVSSLAILTSCSHFSSTRPDPSPKEQNQLETTQETAKDEPEKTPQKCPVEETPIPRHPQEIFDESLEYCQTAQNFWEQGELDKAISALDKAYELILQVKAADDPALQHQQEDLRIMISRRILEIYASRHTTVANRFDAIPKIVNRYVEREIKRFQKQERRFFLSAYKRSGRYRPMIVDAFKKAGLPEELSWVPLIESGFRLKALSPARALGLWQFIPSTGYRFGLSRDHWVDERMDAKKSTHAAVAYLRELHRIFGDWTTALAAYNCGEGRVLRLIRRQKINYLDNFWDLYEKLPEETARYVPRIMAAMIIIENPEKYGFQLPLLDPELRWENLSVSKAMSLDEIAKSIPADKNDLKLLNSELRQGVTPPTQYPLKIPTGTAMQLVAQLDKIPTYVPPKNRFSRHRVKEGETLSHIAYRYKTGIRTLARMNRINIKRPILIGQMIKVPYKEPRPRKSVAQVTRKQPKNTTRHQVRAGDSLWIIARTYDTTVNKLKRLNRLRNNDLHIGQMLAVPGHTQRPTPATSPYRVKPGDSPYKIAKEHNMDLDRLLKINQLDSRSRIHPGQSLNVDADEVQP